MNFFADLELLILAGGFGTRLRPVVSDVPKPLAPVNGRPYLSYLLQYLNQRGMFHAVISVGYMAETVEQRLGTCCEGISLDYSREDRPLGTGGAVALALKRIRAPHLMILNGDSFIAFDPAQLYAGFLAHHPERNGVILGAGTKDVSRYGALDVASDGCLRKFLEKGHSGPGLINAGVYLFSSEMLKNTLPRTTTFSLEKDYFPDLAAGKRLFVSVTNAELLDIGTPESFEYAQQFFLEKEKQTC